MKQKSLSLVLTSDISISKITNLKDKLSSKVYKNKAERMSINLNLKGLMFLRTLFSTRFEYITLIT